MQIISGPIGRQSVHFEAPSATRLASEMQEFLPCFGCCDDIDPVLKAGIAHFWFVTIHPFDDGNGRIGRAICDMALARSNGLREFFAVYHRRYSVSVTPTMKRLSDSQGALLISPSRWYGTWSVLAERDCEL